MMQQRTVVNNGDIVWVRVQFPHQWWPALVLGSDLLGVFVSFFNHRNTSPRYFVESEVFPFEQSFRWLVGHQKNKHKCETFNELLDSALRLLGQRVLSSLKCCCQMPETHSVHCVGKFGNRGKRTVFYDGSGSSSFQPTGLLGFVLNAAVMPRVDEPDFADAVKGVAQVQAFRAYCSIKQKRVYKEEASKTGNDVKLHPCSSVDEKMHSFTQESVAFKSKDKYQIKSKQVEKILSIGAIRRLNSTIPLSEGNSEPLSKNQRLVIQQTQSNQEAELLKEISSALHFSAFDPLYMVRESLKSEKKRFLRFKIISDKGIGDFCLENCSKMSRTYFSVPNNFKTHLSNYVNSRKDIALELWCRLPDIEPTIYHAKKRRRLDQPASCDFSFMQQIIQSFYSTDEAFAYLQIIKSGNKKDNSDVYGLKMGSYKVSLLQSPNQYLSVTRTCRNSWMNLVYTLACCLPLLKDASYHSFPRIGRVQESEANAEISIYTRPNMSHIKKLDPEESSQKDNQACICPCETTMKFTDEVQKVDFRKNQSLTLQQSFTHESSSNLAPDTHSNNCEVDASAAKIDGMLGSESSVYKKRLQRGSYGNTLPLKEKKSTRVNLSSGDCLMENKDQSVAFCSIFNSKVGQQSKTHSPFVPSTSLYMKFPKNFKLPSKRELIKKFSVFGSVDSSRTSVFCYGGSAQVAFFQEVDAVAAFLYAKKKKVDFSKANVRFWLDPFELKRRRSASKPVGPPLKSCLKNSESLKKENRRKHYKVRFTIET